MGAKESRALQKNSGGKKKLQKTCTRHTAVRTLKKILKEQEIYFIFIEPGTHIYHQGRQAGTVDKSDWATSGDRAETAKLLEKIEQTEAGPG